MSPSVNEHRSSTAPEFSSQTGRTLLNLREMLLRGDFQPGERLSELPLVARLGVSRTPIRLALDRLANEGLLEIWPTGGFVVRAFTLTDAYDAIEMRGVLEGAAARLAAERLQDRDELTALRALQKELETVMPPAPTPTPTIDSFARYLDLNESFHSALIDLAKSPMLRRTLDRVLSLPFASPSAMVFARSKLPGAANMLTIGQEQHHALLEALEKRQGTRAEALAREHVQLSRRNLESVLADEAILQCVPGSSLILRTAAVN